jgi:hypothetical protein
MTRKEYNKRARKVLANSKGQGPHKDRKIVAKMFHSTPHTIPDQNHIASLVRMEEWKAKDMAKWDAQVEKWVEKEIRLAEKEGREPRPMLEWSGDSRIVGNS